MKCELIFNDESFSATAQRPSCNIEVNRYNGDNWTLNNARKDFGQPDVLTPGKTEWLPLTIEFDNNKDCFKFFNLLETEKGNVILSNQGENWTLNNARAYSVEDNYVQIKFDSCGFYKN